MDISEKEREIIKLVADGHTNREAAKLLYMSHQAFKWNLSRLRERFGCKNTKELLSFAYKNEMVERISQKANNQDHLHN